VANEGLKVAVFSMSCIGFARVARGLREWHFAREAARVKPVAAGYIPAEAEQLE
jgi:hypothetical protein